MWSMPRFTYSRWWGCVETTITLPAHALTDTAIHGAVRGIPPTCGLTLVEWRAQWRNGPTERVTVFDGSLRADSPLVRRYKAYLANGKRCIHCGLDAFHGSKESPSCAMDHVCPGNEPQCPKCGRQWDFYADFGGGLVYTSRAVVEKYRALYGEPTPYVEVQR